MTSLERLDCIAKILYGKYAYILKKINRTGEYYVLKYKIDGNWHEHTLGRTYQDAVKEMQVWKIA